MENRKFSPEQFAQLGKRSDSVLALEWNCSLKAVQYARRTLGIVGFNREKSIPSYARLQWPQSVLDQLGKVSDRKIAKLMKCPARIVCQKRKSLGIGYFVQVLKRAPKPRARPQD